jgi:predicted ArsR family transcriptional regulator
MTPTQWDERFLASTRGRVVTLLRRGRRTVDELASAVGLTDNAVRAHLAALERDGLVQQTGTRPTGGKPAYAYDLTPDAERLFPKAYGPILRGLLDVLAERLAPDELEAALHEVGRRVAAGCSPTGDRRARVHQAMALLGELGGLAEVEEGDEGFVITGCDCPLAAIVPGHPEACRLAQALMEEVIGAPVVERCERSPIPRCWFVVPTAATAAPRDATNDREHARP